MRKILTNADIFGVVQTLGTKDCFVYTMRMPMAIRHALRINQATLFERYKVYEEEKNGILKDFVDRGHAVQDGNKVSIPVEYKDEFTSQIEELEKITNDVELESIPSDILDEFLNTHDLTLAEENILMLFKRN